MKLTVMLCLEVGICLQNVKFQDCQNGKAKRGVLRKTGRGDDRIDCLRLCKIWPKNQVAGHDQNGCRNFCTGRIEEDGTF